MKLLICPYCGQTQSEVERCRSCGGLLEPLSRQATHNAMGPWFVRDPDRPHQPGCSYETLVQLVEREQIAKHTIIRGPTTRQFWTIAKRVPGVAHLLGYCHNCAASVDRADHGCHACGVPFGAYLDRNYLGLPEIRPLPWEAQLEENDPARFAGRSVQFSQRGQAAGLSSFASDEELLGEVEVGSSGPTAGGAAGAPAGARAAATSAPSEPVHAPEVGSASKTPQVGANLFDDYATAAAVTRSLQRKIVAQQRMIRGLGAAVVIFVLVAAVVGLASLVDDSGPQTRGDGTQGSSDVGGASADQAADAPQVPTGPRTSDPVPSRDGASPAPAQTDQEPQTDPPGQDPQDDYAKAMQLIKTAQQVDRPTKDRIKDYEEALRLLQAIASEAPDDAQPDDLSDTIERTNKALELLRLEDFFP
ncbi:MAG: hypothetical protein V3T53_07085 [Phycisphaerales bacterium]